MRIQGWSPGRLVALCAIGVAAWGASGCSNMRAAAFDHEVYVIKGVATITFGSAGISWLVLQAGVSSVDVTPEPGAHLTSATMRVFEDANHNGAYDTGERQHSFQATNTQNGLSFSNVSVSASDVSGWDTDSMQCSVEISDATGGVSVWTHPI